MATSIYVYQNENQYRIFYPNVTLKDKIFHGKLVDLYVKSFKNSKQLWIITDSEIGRKEKPNLTKSVVHFRTGNCDKFKDGTEKLVCHGKIFYDYKRNKLIIEPRWFDAPFAEFQVDRYVGNILHKSSKIIDYLNHNYELDYDKRFYDLSRDRINLILYE